MEFASPKVEFRGNETVKMAQHGNDAGLLVEFHMEQVLQTFLSEEKGEAVYMEIPHISITTLGRNKITRPVKLRTDANGQSDPERFPSQWKHFQDGTKQLSEGTPLIVLKFGNTEMRQLEIMNILTVERLAEVPDFALEDIGLGAIGLRETARKWLSSNEAEKIRLTTLEKENAEMRSKQEEMQKQIDQLITERVKIAEAQKMEAAPRKKGTDDKAEA